jgi:hypothetical protein
VAPTYYIDLVLSGRQIQFFPLNPVIRFVQGAGALPLGFPASTCPDANIVRRLRSRPYRSNSVIPLSVGVRRPCQITIDDPHRGMAAPLSLVVYHAPVGQNNSRSPLYGTLLGFASDALAAAASGYVGDFNIVNGNDLTVLRDRANALNYNGQTWGAGAYNNTSVHAAIAGAGAGWHSGAGVLTSPRDIGLGTAANSTDVPSVLDWLNVQARPMRAAGTFINDNRDFIINTLLPLYAAYLPANADQVLNAFYGIGGAAYPPTTDARTGQALIFNLLLSDHLPVRIVQN